jgi:hypothetical protein
VIIADAHAHEKARAASLQYQAASRHHAGTDDAARHYNAMVDTLQSLLRTGKRGK